MRSDKITPIHSPLKVFVVVDLFDVPISEKVEMQREVQSNLRQAVQENESIMPIRKFINNVRNR